MRVLLIPDALAMPTGEGEGMHLHPALAGDARALSRYRRQWFSVAEHNPLGWHAAICGVSPAALLAARCSFVDDDVRQCWVASPYHAMLGRDSVRVLPEGEMPLHAADARWLCDVLNPLLGEEGMRLHAVGGALLLACAEALDAAPAPFAAVAGGFLPNRSPEGADGVRLMRLLAEIQMLLHGKQTGHRGDQPAIHGLWLWGACAWPQQVPAEIPPVATRNSFLQAVSDGQGARFIISDAEHVHDLLPKDAALPGIVVLSGAGRAVLLRKSLRPAWGQAQWRPKDVGSEKDLLTVLRKFHAA